MNIHRRLAEVHMSLMNMTITKSGYNKHKHFYYYELEDILPPVLKECYKQKISVEFTYCEGVAILKLVDWDNPKEYIPFRIQMPEVIVEEGNPNNKLIQNLGANTSYLQRYLLKLAFPCLTDKDLVDSDTKEASSEKTSAEKVEEPKKQEVADLNVPSLLVEAEKKLKAKGIEEITPKMLKMQVRNLRNWSVPERRAINNYFKEEGL